MRYLSNESIAARNRRRNLSILRSVPKPRSPFLLMVFVVVTCVMVVGCQAFLRNARDIVHRAVDCSLADDASCEDHRPSNY